MHAAQTAQPPILQKLFASSTKETSWLWGYLALVVIPWGLIFDRGVADGAGIFLSLLWLWRSYKTKDWLWLKDPVVKAGFIAWAWLMLSALFAINVTDSLGIAAVWIRYILCYAAATQWLLRDERAFALLTAMLALMMGFILVDTLWQYLFAFSLTGNEISETGRLTGPFNNVKVGIFLAKMVYPTVGLMLAFAIRWHSRLGAFAAISLLFASIFIMLLTGERTAFTSTMIALMFLAGLIAMLDSRHRKLSFICVGVVLAVIAALAFTQPWVQERMQEFYTDISNISTSNYGQLVIAGYKMGTQHWATGVGLKSFHEVCVALMDSKQVIYCNVHPHNAYMEWFAGAGILGLISIIAIVTMLVRKCLAALQRKEMLGLVVPLFVLATLIVNFFPLMPTQSQFSNWPGILLWYSVSLAMASLNLLAIPFKKPEN